MVTANTTFIIYDTEGNAVTAIQPNTLNGPGGVQASSDLEMYGLGFVNWGEGVNQNDYRLLQNFACQSVAAFPSSARYASLGAVVAAITPANGATDELGTGANGAPNGINYPVVGQLWFNTTQQQLYVYKETSPNVYQWELTVQVVTVSSTQPSSPSIGELWYSISTQQLSVWNGTGWVSVTALYLPLTGGTITGTVTMNGANLNMNGNRITSVPNTPTASTDAINANYVNSLISGISGFVSKTGDTMTGTLTMSSAGITIQSGTLSLTGASSIAVSGTGPLNFGNQRLQHIGYPSVSTDAARADWVNNNFFPYSGGTLNGTLNMNGHSIINVPTPVNANDGVNKAYVDGKVSTIVSGPPIPRNGGGLGQIVTVLDASTSVPYYYTFPTSGNTWFYQFYTFAYYESGNWWLAPMGGVFAGVANGGSTIALYPQLAFFNAHKQVGEFTGNGVQVMGTLWRLT